MNERTNKDRTEEVERYLDGQKWTIAQVLAIILVLGVAMFLLVHLVVANLRAGG